MGESERTNPYFSIVMPVYNGEKYIRRMLNGILSQTFSNWELIVVDDCSMDKSAEIIAEAAKKDGRIRLICQEKNSGVSSARNRGIEEACGKYLWFADADDSVDSDLLNKVYKSLQINPARLVIFGLIEEYYDAKGNYQYSHTVSHKEKYFHASSELRKEMIYLERETLYGYPWNKVYDLEYLKRKRITFSDYRDAKFIEDIKFNIEYCMDIDTLNIMEFCPYHYAKRMQNNLTNEYVKDYFKFHRRRIELLLRQYVRWELCTTEVKEILGSLYGRYILSAMERNCDKRSGMNTAQRFWWCRRLFKQELFCDLIPAAKAEDSRMLAVTLKILQKKSALLCLLMGRGIYIVRKGLPMIYSKIKSGR